MAKTLSLALPRDWTKRVQSAFLHAVGIERLALTEVRAGFDNSPDPRVRQTAEIDRLREQLVARDEQIRILCARIECIAPHERPNYPPAERFAILALRTRVGWNTSQTARAFGLTAPTIKSWMRRLDEQGPDALVKTPEPVNRHPDFVTALVQKLHRVAPTMGRRKLAQLLARAGLVLAASTARRMLRKAPPKAPAPAPSRTQPAPATQPTDKPTGKSRIVRADYVHHVWHVDQTLVPAQGFWTTRADYVTRSSGFRVRARYASGASARRRTAGRGAERAQPRW
mgnify:CR=1 FL=1